MKYFLGVDPGRLGGAAMIDENNEIVEAVGFTAKTYKDKEKILYDILCELSYRNAYLKVQDLIFDKHIQIYAIVEKPRIWPGVKMRNLSQLIRDAGIWEGWLQAIGAKTFAATPTEWQSPIMAACGEKYSSKNSLSKNSRVSALVKFHYGETVLKTRCMGKRGGLLDGVCDALLIAKFLQLRRIDD